MDPLPIEPSCALDEAGLRWQRERYRRVGTGALELSCGSVDLVAIIGVAIAGTEAISAEKLVSRANAAMYRSQEQRQGLPVLASPALVQCL